MFIVSLLCPSASVVTMNISKRALVVWHPPGPHTVVLFKSRPSGIGRSDATVLPVSNVSVANFGVNGSLGLRFTKPATKSSTSFEIFCLASVPDRYVVSTFLPDNFVIASPGAAHFPIAGPATF
jgi:hypothetical protein